MPFSSLRSRIGVPQILALALLLVFAGQCLWLMVYLPLSEMESFQIESGLLQLERLAKAGGRTHSPLAPLVAGLAARLSGAEKHIGELNAYRVAVRAPFLIAGLLLGASVWYVARRLYGNVGGYVALILYCFSPVMVGWASRAGPEILGAWGAFGVVFTAIAVAHTLYAPREVVLWNWRRILLLGVSIAMCVGARFTLWIVLVPALAFMLWVGHRRRGAALVILAASCAIALLLLWAVYSFRPAVYGQALAQADWLGLRAAGFSSSAVADVFGPFFLDNGVGLVLLLGVTLGTFVAWKHTRFFGTAAPLIVAVLLLAVAALMNLDAFPYLLTALPFLMVFMAGVSADLLESRYAVVANAVVGGVLIANAMLDIYGLAQLTTHSR